MTEKKLEKAVDAPAEKPVEKKAVKTAAEKIWDEIKDLKIEMFALPDQRVHHYCKPVTIDPSKLFLIASAGSALPSLEAAIAPKYVVEKQDRFIVVTPAPAPVTVKK
jgi:hypothetical protein